MVKPQTDSAYFAKLRNFERLFHERVEIALAILGNGSAAGREILSYQKTFTVALDELAGLYTAKFIDETLPPDKVAALTTLEADIAMATQQNLEIMRRMLRAQSGTRGGPVGNWRLRRLTTWMKQTSSALNSRATIPLSLRISIPQLLLAGRKPVRTACSLVNSSLTRKSLTKMADALDSSNFLRTDEIRFEGIEYAREQIANHPKRVLVMISNHDLAIFDGTIAYRLALLLGSEHHLSMTRKKIYPIPPPESAGDVIYVDEEDPNNRPVADSVEKVRESLTTHSCVSLAILPEGMMPFTGAQMPLITKEGAHVIARKLSVELQDLGAAVILVESNLNVLCHLTTRELTEARLSIRDVAVVPTTPMGRGGGDEWIRRARLESETHFNTDRGERMLDILCSGPLPESMTYPAETLGTMSAEFRGRPATPVS
jgi:hypothetical protein